MRHIVNGLRRLGAPIAERHQRQHGFARRGPGRARRLGQRLQIIETIPQLQNQPFGRARTDPGSATDRGAVAIRHGLRKLGRRKHAKDGNAELGTDPIHANQRPEQIPLGSGSKSVQRLRILAHQMVNEELRLHRTFRERRRGSRRKLDLIAHAMNIDHRLRAREFEHPPPQATDHGGVSAAA